MNRLLIFLSLCLTSTLILSCLTVDTKKTFSEDPNRITSDELMYEMVTADAQIASQLNTSYTSENTKGTRLNNSTLQEMLVVYTHLIMSEQQIELFENQFNSNVKESGPSILPQNEIQDIMDFSFESVLSEVQFSMYNEWRILGTQ